jgi:hypothetical protein
MTCEYEKQVQHLARLGPDPAWREYIWQRLNELDQTPMFAGIKDDVIQRIESTKQQKG